MRSSAHRRDDEPLLLVDIEIDPSSLDLVPTPFGVIVDLDDFAVSGELGGPGFPSRSIRVALPPNTEPGKVRWEVKAKDKVSTEPVLVAPLQRPRPGVEEGRHEPPKEEDLPRLRPSSTVIDREPLVEALPRPPFVPPSEDLYRREAEKPKRVARLIATEQIGLTPVAVIEINPVAYESDGTLSLVTSLQVSVEYRITDKPTPPGAITSRAQASRLVELARMLVVNPDLVWDITDLYPELLTDVDYLVVTDDQTWNPETIAPIGPAGALTAEFARLADWKQRRGLRSRVITVTDIVAGRYGNHRSGARDLQEVIRRFLRWAHQHWGVAWVLLGGDIGIIPMRRVPGASEGHVGVEGVDPPAPNRSFWTGAFLKMHVAGPGTWFPGSVSGLTLVRPDTGMTIPFDPAGGAGFGWHFTTDNTYTTTSAAPTKFVRVNGPAGQVNVTLQWIYNWNHIPTDLYYSSLIGPNYGGAAHDWDLIGNGLYGQHTNDVDLDGVEYRADVSVGRAPVSSAAQAAAFVDKVIAYESFRNPDGSPLDPSWTRKLLMVSSNWGGRVWIGSTTSSPPGDWAYHHGAGSDHSLIHLGEAFQNMEWRLLSSVAPTDVRLIPYERSAGAAVRGWKYAVSDTDLSTSEISFSIFGLIFDVPIPTNWVVVYGQADELAPTGFIFDHITADGSLSDQEKLREQIAADFPSISDVWRLYEDEVDLTPAQAGAGPFAHLTEDRLRDRLDDGPHFVSLSGHGNSNGCCGLSVAMATNLHNGLKGFIAYADSCLTNQFDAEDAVSEALVYNPGGGAVAYVGNARFSWIGVGDNFQRRFFERLKTTRHLGLLNDTRTSMVNEGTGFWRLYNKWEIFSLNLMGDPEMPVWTGPPRTMTVQMPHDVDRRLPFQVMVRHRVFGLSLPLSGAVVSIEQGSFRRTAITSGSGVAGFDIAATTLGAMEVTVTKIGYMPFFGSVEVVGPAWVKGRVRVVAHQHPDPHHSLVELVLDSPIEGRRRRSWLAANLRPDYGAILDAVTDAYISGKKINLYVASIKPDGLIERFRFGPLPGLLGEIDLRREGLSMFRPVEVPDVVMELAPDGVVARPTEPAVEVDLREEEEVTSPRS